MLQKPSLTFQYGDVAFYDMLCCWWISYTLVAGRQNIQQTLTTHVSK